MKKQKCPQCRGELKFEMIEEEVPNDNAKRFSTRVKCLNTNCDFKK